VTAIEDGTSLEEVRQAYNEMQKKL
jgi:hypothetical protein